MSDPGDNPPQDSVMQDNAPAYPSRIVKKQVPQKTVNDFWRAFTTKFPGKIHNIIPNNAYARSRAKQSPKGSVSGCSTTTTYDEARAECSQIVDEIARECRRVNLRYRDPHFDLEFDLKLDHRNCLDGLDYEISGGPKSVKRVHQIFENPKFYVEGASSNDVRQGRAGDCWFLAALGALGNKKGLIENVCVRRDEKVGVYGFVFHRDGEWIYTVIDDKLFLSVPDYDESLYEKVSWMQIPNRLDAEEEYRKVYQTGSRALYFAQCNAENETWLPLLEKAFAKAHGDYSAIEGGFTGEAIEDLTGGVTTELFTSDILDTDRFWEEELRKVNDEFLFGCATGRFDDWLNGGNLTDRKGIQSSHAYSIMDAVEVKGERLLKVRNPWGQTEWNGPWSDGSEQWTPEWMNLLDHRFGDDGVFWISYKDLLRKYQFFDRTRLFSSDWKVAQQWTTVDVPWSVDYNDTKFSFTLSKPGPVVIMLSQLDDRYWDGLQGQYQFSLHFRVSKVGEEGYIVRSHGNYSMTRSVSAELDLDAGSYHVLMKITAKRNQRARTVEEVVMNNCKTRQEKLLQVGLSYDLGHAKALVQETDEEKKMREEHKAKAEAKAREKARVAAKKRKKAEWDVNRRRIERQRREKARLIEHKKKKAALKAEEEDREAAKTQADTKDAIGESRQEEPKEVGEVAIAENAVAKSNESGAAPAGETEVPAEKASGEATSSDAGSGVVVNAAEGDSPSSDRNQTEVPAVPSGEAPGENTEGTQTADAAAVAEGVEALPSPPATPGQVPEDNAAGEPPAGPSEESDDAETVVSWVSSIDSDLDDDFFQSPDYKDEDGEGTPSTLDDEDTAKDPTDAAYVLNGDDEDPNFDPTTDEDLAEFANDPWNAVCAVGLRIYARDDNVSVKVVRPWPWPNEKSEDVTVSGGAGGGEGPVETTAADPADAAEPQPAPAAPLDDDDPSKGLTADEPSLAPPVTSELETEAKANGEGTGTQSAKWPRLHGQRRPTTE